MAMDGGRWLMTGLAGDDKDWYVYNNIAACWDPLRVTHKAVVKDASCSGRPDIKPADPWVIRSSG